VTAGASPSSLSGDLRLVRKEGNLERSHQTRIKRQKKDLVIE